MRILLTSVICLLIAGNTYSWGTPNNLDPDKKKLVLIENTDITLSLVDEYQKDVFLFADYNLSEKTLNIKTKNVIHYIQLFNADNQLEFQLYVGSDHVRINKSLIESGDYRLAFLINNEEHLQFISLNVNA